MDVLHAPPLAGPGWLARLDVAVRGAAAGSRRPRTRMPPTPAAEPATERHALDTATRRDLGLPSQDPTPRAQAARLWALAGPAG